MAQVESTPVVSDPNVGKFVENIDVNTLPDLPYKAGYIIDVINNTDTATYLLLDGRSVEAWDRTFSRNEIGNYTRWRGINKYIYIGIGYFHKAHS